VLARWKEHFEEQLNEDDCSESFENLQGLKHGDVLSTLLFNGVLEVIVRRANLQTTGIIYNKETQLLAYADDIDIVGRVGVSQPFGMLTQLWK
jgi:hypothetical protein